MKLPQRHLRPLLLGFLASLGSGCATVYDEDWEEATSYDSEHVVFKVEKNPICVGVQALSRSQLLLSPKTDLKNFNGWKEHLFNTYFEDATSAEKIDFCVRRTYWKGDQAKPKATDELASVLDCAFASEADANKGRVVSEASWNLTALGSVVPRQLSTAGGMVHVVTYLRGGDISPECFNQFVARHVPPLTKCSQQGCN
jgi:hypothetical protein